jgi:triphosphatase
MNSELEQIKLKLRITPEDIVALCKHPSFSSALHDSTRETLNSVYFDSDNRFLYKHGLILRVRRIGDRRVQTIKAFKTNNKGSGPFERSEWEQLIESDQPDLTLVQDTILIPLLTDDVRNALQPIFETQIERTSYHLNENSTEIVMSIDTGQIVATNSSCPISEIGLELKHGNRKELFKIAHRIISVVPAQLDAKSKPERGYELIANAPVAAEMASNPNLQAGMTTGRAFTLIGQACLRQLIANVPATISRDAEALHQLRVALRRLRGAISLFSEIVIDDRVNTIKSELRWLARECGPARDLDTLILEVLNPLRKQNRNEPGLVSISKMFARKRLKSYRQASGAVQSARFRVLVLDAAEWIEVGPWSTSEDAQMRARRETPIEIYAAAQLSERRKKIRRRGANLSNLPPDQLHRLRIQVKKARYATEFLSSVYEGKKPAKRRKAIRLSLMELQDCLGGIHDVATRKVLFADIISSPARGLTAEQNRHRAFAAGLITGNQQAHVQRLLDRARKAYSRFNKAKPFWKLQRRHSIALPQEPASGEPSVSDPSAIPIEPPLHTSNVVPLLKR